MGINLAAVGAVVHACLPRSLEEYVQLVRCLGGWGGGGPARWGLGMQAASAAAA